MNVTGRVRGRHARLPKTHVDLQPGKALFLRFAEELPRLLDFATFQVVSLFDVLHGQFFWRDEHKVEDDIPSPETADV